MRVGDKASFIDNGKKSGHHKVIGVCLGADFTAEHEQGVGPLRRVFGSTRPPSTPWYPDGPSMTDYEFWKAERDNKLSGILGSLLSKVGVTLPDPPAPEMGISKRKITKLPEEGFGWLKSTDDTAEGFGFNVSSWNMQSVVDAHAKMRMGDDLVGAWDNKSFLVLARSDKAKASLRDLYDSVMELDAMFTMPMGFLQTRGLCVIRASDFPVEAAKKLLVDDMDTFIGEKAFHETGIEAVLKTKGKRWFSLGSRFGEGQRQQPMNTWKCWLNPREQDIHNYGYFTIEELRLWGDDKGPVMKSTSKRKRVK